MNGPLKNPRWESFCQELFKGEPASTAYETAGYCFNEGNAIRLKGNEKVQARLAELQLDAQKHSEVTVASLLGELEEARVRATSLNQMSAAVKSITSKAAISGLLTQKIEVTEQPRDFATCNTIEEVGTALLTRLTDNIEGVAITLEDRVACFELLKSLSALVDDIAARAAKPVNIDAAGVEQKRIAAGRKRSFNGRLGR
jgi:phage terminase small subunit